MALDLNELETFQDHISQKPIQDSPKKQKIELTPSTNDKLERQPIPPKIYINMNLVLRDAHFQRLDRKMSLNLELRRKRSSEEDHSLQNEHSITSLKRKKSNATEEAMH